MENPVPFEELVHLTDEEVQTHLERSIEFANKFKAVFEKAEKDKDKLGILIYEDLVPESQGLVERIREFIQWRKTNKTIQHESKSI